MDRKGVYRSVFSGPHSLNPPNLGEMAPICQAPTFLILPERTHLATEILNVCFFANKFRSARFSAQFPESRKNYAACSLSKSTGTLKSGRRSRISRSPKSRADAPIHLPFITPKCNWMRSRSGVQKASAIFRNGKAFSNGLTPTRKLFADPTYRYRGSSYNSVN